MFKIIGGIVFLLIGAGLTWGAYVVTQSTLEFRADSTLTTGTVVEFETERSRNSEGRSTIMYRPVVEFRTETGQSVRVVSSVSSNRPSYNRGEQVPVRYQDHTPEAARLDTFTSNWMGPLILGILGPVMLLVGYALTKSGFGGARVAKWLKQHGKTVTAVIAGVEQNPLVKVNGKLPWRLKATWTDPKTGRAHLFYSQNYWYDPSPILNRDSVEALINPDKPEEYQLDTSFLPKKA